MLTQVLELMREVSTDETPKKTQRKIRVTSPAITRIPIRP